MTLNTESVNLAEVVFGKFQPEEIAELTGKDLRTVMRWKSGKTSDEAEYILTAISQEFGLLDDEIVGIAKRVQQLTVPKREQLRKILRRLRLYKEQAFGTYLERSVPGSEYPLMRLAMTYHEEKKFESQFDLLSHWVQTKEFSVLTPLDQARAWNFLGVAANRLGRHQEAEQWIGKAVALMGQGVEQRIFEVLFRMELAIALDRQGKTEMAGEQLKLCKEVAPTHPLVLYNLMCFHGRHGQQEAADQVAQEMLAVYPELGNEENQFRTALLSDPDLAAYRRTELFRRRFEQGTLFVAIAALLMVPAWAWLTSAFTLPGVLFCLHTFHISGG